MNKLSCFHCYRQLLEHHKILRYFSATTILNVKHLKETFQTDGTIAVGLEDIQDPRPNLYRFKPDPNICGPNGCRCPLCVIPIPITYADVLILEQFMREDGTVIPREFTGLCEDQQHRLERCVMQAHWSHLFPDRALPDFDQSGYKRFNRHWENDTSMYRTFIKVMPGTWFYINRYNSKKLEYRTRKRPLWPKWEPKLPPLPYERSLQQQQKSKYVDGEKPVANDVGREEATENNEKF